MRGVSNHYRNRQGEEKEWSVLVTQAPTVLYCIISIYGIALDLVTQVRDVVFVKCIFSLGKPQGVGIS